MACTWKVINRTYNEKQWSKITAKSVDSFISVLSDSIGDPVMESKLIAVSKKLYGSGSAVYLMPRTLDPLIDQRELDDDVWGYYDPASRSYVLFNDGNPDPEILAGRFLHEALHEITVPIIAKQESGISLDPAEKKYVDDMSRLYSDFRMEMQNAGIDPNTIYGLSSMQEFASEVFRSHDLQVFMGAASTSNKTPWSRFIDAIMDLLINIVGGTSQIIPGKQRARWILRQAAIANEGIVKHVSDRPHSDIVDEYARKMDPMYIKNAKRGGSNNFKSDIEKDKKRVSSISNLSDMLSYFTSSVPITVFGDSKNNTISAEIYAESLVDNFIRKNRRVQLVAYGPKTQDKYFIEKDVIALGVDPKTADEKDIKKAVAEIYKKDILPRENKYEGEFRTKTLEWLRRGADPADYAGYFGGDKKGPFPESQLKEFLDHIDHRSGDKYYTLEEAKSEGIINFNLSELTGYDPIIKLRTIDNVKYISVIDMNTDSLFSRHKTLRGRSLFYPFTRSNDVDIAKGVTLSGNIAGLRSLAILIQIGHIIKENPSVVLDNAMTISMKRGGISKRAVLPFNADFKNLDVLKEIDPVYSNLPASIKAAVNYKDYIKESNTMAMMDYIKFISSFYVDRIQKTQELNFGVGSRGTTYMQHFLDTASKTQTDSTSLRYLIELIKKRISHLEKRVKTDKKTDESYVNELEQLSRIISEYTASNIGQEDGGIITPIGLRDIGESFGTEVQRIFTNPHNAENPLVQAWYEAVMKGTEATRVKSENILNDYQKHLDKFLKATGARKVGLADSPWKIFEPMFITEDVPLSSDKNVVRTINTGRIHWDPNDPSNSFAEETKKALAEGKITQAHIDFGTYLVNMFQDIMVSQEMQFMAREFISGVPDVNQLRELAEKKINSKDFPWKKGFIPVIYKETNEQMTEFNISKAWEAFKNSAKNPETIFEDPRYLNDISDEKGSFTNWFLTDIGTSSYGGINDYQRYGNDERMSKLGLIADANGFVNLDTDSNKGFDKNQDMSKNLDRIFRIFVTTSVRKMEFDKNVIPVTNSIKRTLQAFERSTGQDMSDNLKYIENLGEKLISMRMRKVSDKTLFGRTANNVASIMQPLASWTGTAFSLPVGILSIVSGIVKTTSFVAARGIYDNVFGAGELTAALKEAFSPGGVGKMLAIARHYGVIDATEQDLIDNPEKNKFKRYILQSHYLQLFNYYPDIMIRGTVMVAQMMKDGTYEAHTYDNEKGVIYDEKLDRRFYDKHGNFIKSEMANGKKLYERIRQDIIMDEIYDQQEEGPLKFAYTWRQANKLKLIADKMVIGSMDPKTQSEVDTHVYGKLFMQFKRHLPDAFFNTFGKKETTRFGLNSNYKYDKNKDDYVWMADEMKGWMNTIYTLLREEKGAGAKKIMSAIAGRNPDGMSQIDIFNSRKAAYDIILFSVLMLLYSGLVDERDDDDKDEMGLIYENRAIFAIRNALMDLVSTVWPGSILYTMSNPIPALSIANATWGVVYSLFTFEKPERKDLRRITPLLGTIESLQFPEE